MPETPPTRKVKRNVVLPKIHWEALKRMAVRDQDSETSVSTLIRRSVREFLGRNGEETAK